MAVVQKRAGGGRGGGEGGRVVTDNDRSSMIVFKTFIKSEKNAASIKCACFANPFITAGSSGDDLPCLSTRKYVAKMWFSVSVCLLPNACLLTVTFIPCKSQSYRKSRH